MEEEGHDIVQPRVVSEEGCHVGELGKKIADLGGDVGNGVLRLALRARPLD